MGGTHLEQPVTAVFSVVGRNRADDTAPCCSGLSGRRDRGIVVAEAYGHVVPAHRGDGLRHGRQEAMLDIVFGKVRWRVTDNYCQLAVVVVEASFEDP